jgi:hypothetical protein
LKIDKIIEEIMKQKGKNKLLLMFKKIKFGWNRQRSNRRASSFQIIQCIRVQLKKKNQGIEYVMKR